MKRVGGVSPCILLTAAWGKGGAKGQRWKLQVETLPCSGSRVAGKTCMSAGSSLRWWNCLSFSPQIDEIVFSRLHACFFFVVMQDEGEKLESHTLDFSSVAPFSP